MENIPYHLGIILDGNRRWAIDKGLPSFEGHRQGLEIVKKATGWCKNRGIKTLTLFVFSTENWKRAKLEVDFLMNLTEKTFSGNLKEELHREGIKVRVIGQREKLPVSLQKAISQIEELTKNNKAMTLNFALSYGGRAEIVEAIKNILRKKITPEDITEKIISENLWTSDVDLIIRTGKEQRISNFLIWQSAYSELCFLKKYWPDFTENDLDAALVNYAECQRKFGK